MRFFFAAAAALVFGMEQAGPSAHLRESDGTVNAGAWAGEVDAAGAIHRVPSPAPAQRKSPSGRVLLEGETDCSDMSCPDPSTEENIQSFFLGMDENGAPNAMPATFDCDNNQQREMVQCLMCDGMGTGMDVVKPACDCQKADGGSAGSDGGSTWKVRSWLGSECIYSQAAGPDPTPLPTPRPTNEIKANDINEGQGIEVCPATHKFACPREGMQLKTDMRHYAMVGLTCGSDEFSGCGILAPRFFGEKIGSKLIEGCQMLIDKDTANWHGGPTEGVSQQKGDWPIGEVIVGGKAEYKCPDSQVMGGIGLFNNYVSGGWGSDEYNQFGFWNIRIYCGKLLTGKTTVEETFAETSSAWSEARPDRIPSFMDMGEDQDVSRCMSDMVGNHFKAAANMGVTDGISAPDESVLCSETAEDGDSDAGGSSFAERRAGRTWRTRPLSERQVRGLMGSSGIELDERSGLHSHHEMGYSGSGYSEMEAESYTEGGEPWTQEEEEETGPDPWDEVDQEYVDAVGDENPEDILQAHSESCAQKGMRAAVVVGIWAKSGGKEIGLICKEVGSCFHGTCEDGSGMGACKCTSNSGWFGHACNSKEQDQCEGLRVHGEICGGHGECVDGGSAKECVCDKSKSMAESGGRTWEGKEYAPPLCAKSADGCSGIDCMHGTCQDQGGNSYHCVCDEGWSNSESTDLATPCDVERIDCQGEWVYGMCDAQCQRMGTFVVKTRAQGTEAGAQECEAEHNEQMSHDCEDPSDGLCTDCAGKDCNNHGECTDGVGCECEAPWTGQNCEMLLDDCAKNTCNGKGHCVGDPPSCVCWHGWDGDKCTKDPCDGCKTSEGHECGFHTQGECFCAPGFMTDTEEGENGVFCGINLGAQQDCEGEWGDYGDCVACFKEREYRIITPKGDAKGSRPCQYEEGEIQKKKCGEPGSPECCSIAADECVHGEYNADHCSCECQEGWFGALCNVETQTEADLTYATTKFSDADMAIEQVDPNDKWGDVNIDVIPCEPTPEEPCAGAGIPLWVWLVIGGAVLLIAAGVGGYFWWKKRKEAQMRAQWAAMQY